MSNQPPETPREGSSVPGFGQNPYAAPRYGDPQYGDPQYGDPQYEAPEAPFQAYDAPGYQTPGTGTYRPYEAPQHGHETWRQGEVPPQGVQPYGGSYPPQAAYGYGQPEHPQATTVLILGILGLFIAVTGPFAWIMGNRARRDVAAGQYAPSTSLTIGWVLGIVTTIYLLVLAVLMVLALAFFAAMVV